jgi:hypothetical protein
MPVEVRLRLSRVLFREPISLGSGAEWHSSPVPLRAGDDLKITAQSTVRFYAGLYDEPVYATVRRRGAQRFPFRFGTDQTFFQRTYSIRADGAYRVVFRIGGWTRPGTIQAEIERILPPGAGEAP